MQFIFLFYPDLYDCAAKMHDIFDKIRILEIYIVFLQYIQPNLPFAKI